MVRVQDAVLRERIEALSAYADYHACCARDERELRAVDTATHRFTNDRGAVRQDAEVVRRFGDEQLIAVTIVMGDLQLFS